ncbi:MAG: tpa [Firmicutes bacterium]|nr:tpa [Bacillota bacterium]
MSGACETKTVDVDSLVKMQREHLWLHLTNHKMFETQEPQIMVEAKGLIVKDARGNEYLDALSGGVWGVSVGYGRESIVDAVAQQLRILPYYAGTVATPPYIMLADKVSNLLPALPKMYLSNSGSEANEKAFKIARQFMRSKYPAKDKFKIIYRDRDYHGTTLAALSATGQNERKVGYGPLLEGFVGMPHALCYRCAFGKEYPGCNIDCAQVLEDVITREGEDSVAAVILEPITAGGGIIPPVKEYYPIIQEICRKHDVLLILDEVVNGFGRTGKMFGHQHYDVDPDMVTLGKGFANSYMPLSATVAKQYLFDQFLAQPEDLTGYFRDISTYGGCTAGCSAALETIRILEAEKLVENSAAMGEYLLQGLKEFEKHPMVGQVRGRGLFVGVEMVEDKKTKTPAKESILAKIVGDVKAQGVIMGRMGRSLPNMNNVLTLAPALIATKAEIDQIVGAIGKALGNLK